MITADHKFCVKDVNLETVTDTASWYKIWQLNGFNHIRAKPKLLRRRKRGFRKFLEPTKNPKVIYTDNSLEFGKACEDLSWNHCTSTPHRSETNGIAEGAVRRIKEGTSAVLLQSGLDEKWLAVSTECYCYLWKVQDLLSDGKTPYERRFGEPLKGPIVPVGSMVEYHPFPPKTCQDFISSARKSYQQYSSVMHYTRGESGKETCWSQTLKNWRRWTHLKSMVKDSMKRKC